MPTEQYFAIDHMQEEELDFIRKKYNKETRLFQKSMVVFVIFAIIIPAILGFFVNFFKEEPDEPLPPELQPEPFTLVTYFVVVIFILLLITVGGIISYNHSLKKLKTDLIQKTKIIERSEITRKQFIPNNQSCLFYVNSANKLSIEVSRDDFQRFEVGDEINLEFSKNSKIYFGYF